MERNEKEFFAATLYTCYEYVKPDLALEYAWRFNMYEYVMPFIIQLVSEMRTRENEIKKEQTKEKEKVTATTLDFVSHDLELMMPGSQLMITGGNAYGSVGGMPPGAIPPMGGMPPMGGLSPGGLGMGGMPPMGGNMMGGFGQTSPYGSSRQF